MRLLAFYCAVVLLFLRFSFLPETIEFFTGIRTYILYVFGPPALLGVFAFGGLKRTFSYKPARYWLGFLICMLLAVPFSTWRGDSLALAQTYVRNDFIMLLVTAGLAVGWAECRLMFYALSLAALANIATTRLLMAQAENSNRIFLTLKGSITDPNDLAAHLLLVLPFLLFLILRPRTLTVVRLALLLALTYGLFLVLRGGSRGGFVALIISLIFAVILGSKRQRIILGVAAPIVLLVVVSVLPGSTWQRLNSFTGGEKSDEVALESSRARIYLFKKSLEFTVKRPIFGVGPGQFMNFEGTSAAAEGQHGYWHATHNTYTQVSSECGIPAFIFFVGAIISTFAMLRRIRKKSLGLNKREITTAAFCMTIGLIGYVTASVFLANAYRFQFLAISGVVIAVWRAILRLEATSRIAESSTENSSTEIAELNLSSA